MLGLTGARSSIWPRSRPGIASRVNRPSDGRGRRPARRASIPSPGRSSSPSGHLPTAAPPATRFAHARELVSQDSERRYGDRRVDRQSRPAVVSWLLATSLFGDAAAALRKHGAAPLDEHSCYFRRRPGAATPPKFSPTATAHAASQAASQQAQRSSGPDPNTPQGALLEPGASKWRTPGSEGPGCGNASRLPYWRIWFYLLEAAGLHVQLVSARVGRVPASDR